MCMCALLMSWISCGLRATHDACRNHGFCPTFMHHFAARMSRCPRLQWCQRPVKLTDARSPAIHDKCWAQRQAASASGPLGLEQSPLGRRARVFLDVSLSMGTLDISASRSAESSQQSCSIESSDPTTLLSQQARSSGPNKFFASSKTASLASCSTDCC